MRRLDRPFLITTIALVVLGVFIFSSASLGLLARDGATFSAVAFSQFVFGVGGGALLLLLCAHIPHRFWRRYAPYILAATVIGTLLVFVPGLGFEYNGARRWLSLAGFSIQPAEFLKFGAVVFFAAWLASVRGKLATWRYGLLPFLVLISVIGAILLLQPDTGTFVVIAFALGAMYLSAGARARDVAILAFVALTAISFLALARPYIMERILSFLDPAADPQGAGYQVQQSLIAIGSGEWFGRGFGQSVQKFNFLPEPTGDSIFSVYAEEFGFIGSILLIGLFLFFAFRGLRIGAHAPDYFGGLLVVGLVILIVAQSFINIASMLGVFPLTGLPLLFVSHGGTALLLALAEVGIILSISRYQKPKVKP